MNNHPESFKSFTKLEEYLSKYCGNFKYKGFTKLADEYNMRNIRHKEWQSIICYSEHKNDKKFRYLEIDEIELN